jgi:hypothetical protein
MLSACVVYEVKTGVDVDALYEKLTSGFSHDTTGDYVDTLITDVENVQRTERGVEFVCRYDIEETRPVRESEDPWFPALHKVTVRVTDQYFILNSYDSKNKAASHVSTVLDISPDEYEQVEFSSALLISVVAEDAAELSQGTWEDPTEHADTATIWGQLQDSALYAEFNTDGRASWARFESATKPGHEAGLSTNKDSVVFGTGWELPEMEDYICNQIIPNATD